MDRVSGDNVDKRKRERYIANAHMLQYIVYEYRSIDALCEWQMNGISGNKNDSVAEFDVGILVQ